MDAPDYTYFAFVADTAALSRQADEESFLEAANMLLSIEGSPQTTEALPRDFFRAHFDVFLKYVKYLPKSCRDCLLGYYLLGATQTQLGFLLGHTQTEISTRFRKAERLLGWYILNGGKASPALIDSYIAKANIDGLSEAYKLYTSPRKRGATLNGRYKLVWASKELEESPDVQLRAFSAYLWEITNAKGLRGRRQELTLKDPDYLGEFRMTPPIPKMFESKNRDWGNNEEED